MHRILLDFFMCQIQKREWYVIIALNYHETKNEIKITNNEEQRMGDLKF